MYLSYSPSLSLCLCLSVFVSDFLPCSLSLSHSPLTAISLSFHHFLVLHLFLKNVRQVWCSRPTKKMKEDMTQVIINTFCFGWDNPHPDISPTRSVIDATAQKGTFLVGGEVYSFSTLSSFTAATESWNLRLQTTSHPSKTVTFELSTVIIRKLSHSFILACDLYIVAIKGINMWFCGAVLTIF